VLLLEKVVFPRSKICAGGITARTAKLLDFNFEPVVEDVSRGFGISFRLKPGFTRTYREPLVYMVTRSSFDALNLEKAGEAGASILTGCKVTSFRPEGGDVLVYTEGNTFRTRVFVDASGSNGIRKPDPKSNRRGFAIAFEGEMEVKQSVIEPFRNLITIDYGTISGAYAWVFPKREVLSVGVGGILEGARQLKPYFEQFLEFLRLDSCPIRDFKSALLNIGRDVPPVAGQIIRVGDAAGLVNPLTGEGVYAAVKSARLAVPAIVSFLGGKGDGLLDYWKKLDLELTPKLIIYRWLEEFSERFPRPVYETMKNCNLAWETGCQTLTREFKVPFFGSNPGNGLE
jgi:flavin-dependent dehydrogenase